MKDLIDIKKLVTSSWNRSLGIVLSLIIGVLLGMFIVEGRVIEDCKYLKSFRFGQQSFTCGRIM